MAADYQRPGWFTKHVFNPIVGALTRLGVKLISIRPSTQLHWDAAPTGDPVEDLEVTVQGTRFLTARN